MSIASRINAIEEHIGNAYDRIEDLGIDLSNVDKNINNIASKLEEIYEDYPKVTASNVEETSLSNTNKGRMGIDLKGNTSQYTSTQSANLFDESYYNNDSLYSTNVYKYTLTRIKGNRTLYTKCVLKQGKTSISGLYLCLCTRIHPNVSGHKEDWFVNNGSVISSANNDFSGEEDLYFTYYPSNISLSQIFDTYNLMVSVDNVAYIPFTPDSPSPDYTQTIHKVSGNNNIKIQNKNFFDYANYTYDKTTFNSYRYIEIKNLKPNTQYTIYNYQITDTTTYPNVYLSYKPQYSSMIWTNLVVVSYATATTDSDGKMYLGAYTSSWSKEKWDTFIGYFENAMFIEGTDRTQPFVAHAEQNYPVNLGNIELCKIGTAEDFPFKAVNGDDYYDTLTTEQKNALTYGKWYLHKEIGKVVFDGSNMTNISTFDSINCTFKISNFVNGYDDNQVTLHEIYSNYLIAQTHIGVFRGTTGISVLGGTVNATYLCFGSGSGLTTKPLLETWLQTHNLEICYLLATPTNTEITETTLINELEAILQARSYTEQTNISQTNSDLPFILDIKALRGE